MDLADILHNGLKNAYAGVESGALVAKDDGSYLKTLQLDPLRETDAGVYLCLVTNRYGSYSIEKTYLNVRLSKSISVSCSSPNLINNGRLFLFFSNRLRDVKGFEIGASFYYGRLAFRPDIVRSRRICLLAA